VKAEENIKVLDHMGMGYAVLVLRGARPGGTQVSDE